MKFLQATGFLPTADELKPLTEEQSLAILESLFLTVVADGKVEETEVKAFAASALMYPWNWSATPASINARLDQIAVRLADVRRDTMKDHLQSIGARIPTQVLREKTFAGMFALMIADGVLDEKEKTAALAFAQVFEIPQPRAVEIIQAVMGALMQTLKKGPASAS